MEKLQNFITYFKKRRKLVLVLIVFLIAAAFGWRTFISSKTQQPQYQTAKVERGTIISFVTASGQILTANVIDITTQASGLIKQVFVSEGDKVIAGQKIAEIELDAQGAQKNASAWSSYLSAKNSVNSANVSLYTLQSDMFSKWKTYKDLAESSSYDTPEERSLPQFHIAEKDWLAAEAKYRNQQAVISQTQAALNSAWFSYQISSPIITAPIAGNISNITVVAGIIAGSSGMEGQSATSQKIATIRNENNPLVSFNLSEIDVPHVKIGQKATVTLDSLSGKTFTGKVVSVDKIGQVTNGVTNYPIIIQLDTQAEQFLPNMAAATAIITDSKDNVLIVPSQAVRTSGEQSVVRVVRGGQVQEVPVEVGFSSDINTEIISGLSEGDEVIISTSGTIQQGGSLPFGGGGFGSFGGGGALRPGGTRGGGTQH